MGLLPGSRLGPYEIIGAIGAGGMGEVYRARDAKLQRDVAIKILPGRFAADLDRLARFEREAQTLAALNHPNIAQIYGVEAHAAGHAIVMELVEGETLAERCARGKVPLGEAFDIARQIAEALAAAHDAGIVHRDLKPANLTLRGDGTVKVLDFGLAKVLDTVAAGSAAASTLTSPALTEAGIILGTAAYLSPEQARGAQVDKRTDVWSFGCVVYEMLSGRRAFPGETISDAIGKILEREPDWSALPAETPAPTVHVLRRMLVKDVRQRLRDLGDAAIAFDVIERDKPALIPRGHRTIGFVTAAILAVLFAIAGAAATMLWLRRDVTPAAWATGPIRFDVDPAAVNLNMAISADGTTIAWLTSGADGRRRVAVRSLQSSESRELPGTENATYPFLAPDGHAVGFYAASTLRRMDLRSGTIQVLADTPGVSLGATWSVSDVIVFSNRYGLQAIPASGGTPRQVASLDLTRHENSLRFPEFLPDGTHFVYVARSGRPQESSAYLGSLDAKPVRLFQTLSKVAFAPPGYLLFTRGNTLVAQRFDVGSQALSGDEIPVAAGVGTNTLGMGSAFAVSSTGVLVYTSTNARDATSLHWFDRSGKDLGTLAPEGLYPQIRIAPDGRRVAVAISDERTAGRSVWILQDGQTPARLTQPGTNDWFPVWSRDGTRIAFGSYRDGPLNIYLKTASGAGSDLPLMQSVDQKDPLDWSPDDRYLLVTTGERDVKGDLVAVEVSDPSKRIAVAHTEGGERSGRFSPDGRWIAYVSDETGQSEVWVQPFPPTGAKWQASVGGGDEPAWGRDGAEFFYVNRAGVLVTASIAPNRAAFSAAPARPLFKVGSALAIGGTMRYDASPDGTRFLVVVPADQGPPGRPSLILNWPALLK